MIEQLVCGLVFLVLVHSIILTAAFFTLRQEINEIYDAISYRATWQKVEDQEKCIDQAHGRISDLARQIQEQFKELKK